MINTNFQKLPGSYLFSTVAKKVSAFRNAHPDRQIISLGIGDVTEPLVPAVIEALHRAVDEMGKAETFRGYAPDLGYEFLRAAIAQSDYQSRGVCISPDEIFISDGAKSDSGSIQELFSSEAVIAVCDPVYPVYVDSNILAGRGGEYDTETGSWSRILRLPCTAENGFCPDLPSSVPDMIYLCLPNNPTGTTLTRSQLQPWVDYANAHGAVILFDAAYEAYITERDVPHTIYECDGADRCAIELRSFSKNAGFTGLRLGFTVIPRALKRDGASLRDMWARRHGTKFNGAPYIVQRAGEAVYSKEGKKQVQEQVASYLHRAALMREGLGKAGFTVYGGVNSPYLWLRVPRGMKSWDFFDLLLENTGVVGTPGAGFGACGEGYFRLTAFGSEANTKEALHRIQTFFA